MRGQYPMITDFPIFMGIVAECIVEYGSSMSIPIEKSRNFLRRKKKHFQSRTKKQNIQSSKANFSFKVLTIWIRNSIKFKISKILSEYLHQLGSHHWSPIEATQLRVSGLLTMI